VSESEDLLVDHWSHEKSTVAQGVERRLDSIKESMPLRGQQDSERSDDGQAERVGQSSCLPVVENHTVCVKLKAETQGRSFARA